MLFKILKEKVIKFTDNVSVNIEKKQYKNKHTRTI